MNRLVISKHQHLLGEGVIWDHRSGLLLFVDIISKKLFRMDIDSLNIIDEYCFNEFIGWVQITNNPEYYLIGLKSGIATLNIKSSKIKFINKEIPQYSNQRLNDSFIDKNGKLWYGSMEYKSIELYNGVLAKFSSSENKAIIMDKGYGITNGPVINEQNKYLYHNDSKKGLVYQYYLNRKKDDFKKRNIFLQFDSISKTPDGMCLDKNNNLFIAIWGGGAVNAYNHSGGLIHSYKLPEKFITNICFAGKDFNRMFVTAAKSDDFGISKRGGHIYEILDHNYQGLQANEFIL